MQTNIDFQDYVIRRTGERRQEKILSGGFFAWLYNSPAGMRFRPLLMENPLLHCIIEKFACNSLSRHLVPAFAARTGIDLKEAEKPLYRYRSLNEFFTRRLKPAVRAIDTSSESFITPGDGKLLVFDGIGEKAFLPVKGLNVEISSLLNDRKTAEKYYGGSAMVLRLYLMDYHRLHFPCDGTPHEPVPIKGCYYSVSPVRGNNINFYARNKRALTVFASDAFGSLAFVDIGGFLIASIRHLFKPGIRVQKGDEKSLFQFGGSTLVVLFEKGRIRFDQDLIDNSRSGVETYVRYGEAIGKLPAE